MKENNRLFNALGVLDDSHFRGDELESLALIGGDGAASAKRRPFKKIVIAAAAVAAVLAIGLMVGFYNLNGHPNYVFIAEDGRMNYDVQLKDFDIPDEYNKFEIKENGSRQYADGQWVEKRPSELFAEFGLKPLTSESFSEEFDYTPVADFTFPNGEQHLTHKNSWVKVGGNTVGFEYVLYDNVIGEYVHFAAMYVYDTHIESYSSELQGKVEHEWVTLKNGADCYIHNSGASFSYDGAMYSLSLYLTDRSGIDLTKQVLIDLGLL